MPTGNNSQSAAASEALACALPSGCGWDLVANNDGTATLERWPAGPDWRPVHDQEPIERIELTAAQAFNAAARILDGVEVDTAIRYAAALHADDGCDHCDLPECEACIARHHDAGELCQLADGECDQCTDRRRMARRREAERDDHDFAYECARDDAMLARAVR